MGKRIVLFGGSFDPIHQGHVKIIKLLSEKFDFVYVIPTNVEGYKKNCKMFSFGERCKKVQEAVKGLDNVVVSYIEEHADPSYQFVSSAKFYKEQFDGEDVELYFALGSDSFATIKTWDGWEEIISYCKIAVINRDGNYVLPKDIPYELIDFHDESSSTLIRQKVEKQINDYKAVTDPLTKILRVNEFHSFCDENNLVHSIENYVRYMNKNDFPLNLKELLTI